MSTGPVFQLAMDESYVQGTGQETIVKTGSHEPAGGMKEDPVIERFLDNLWEERGLSDNSLQGDRHDLLHLQGRLADRGETGVGPEIGTQLCIVDSGGRLIQTTPCSLERVAGFGVGVRRGQRLRLQTPRARKQDDEATLLRQRNDLLK